MAEHICRYEPSHHTFDGVVGKAMTEVLATADVDSIGFWDLVGLAVNGLDPVPQYWNSFDEHIDSGELVYAPSGTDGVYEDNLGIFHDPSLRIEQGGFVASVSSGPRSRRETPIREGVEYEAHAEFSGQTGIPVDVFIG
jgi:hypothetical protein